MVRDGGGLGHATFIEGLCWGIQPSLPFQRGGAGTAEHLLCAGSREDTDENPQLCLLDLRGETVPQSLEVLDEVLVRQGQRGT